MLESMTAARAPARLTLYPGIRGGGDCGLGHRARGGIGQLLELLAGLEVGDPLRRHVDLVPCLRVAPLSPSALADAEASETAELELLLLLKRRDHPAEDPLD